MAKAPRKPQQLANARGYAQRQRTRSARQDVADAYEFSNGAVRREKVALDLDRDEERAAKSDNGDSEDDLRSRIAKRVNEDEVHSEDDEEIDSDEAFEGSDEERYASFSFAQRKKARLRVVYSLVLTCIFADGRKEDEGACATEF